MDLEPIIVTKEVNDSYQAEPATLLMPDLPIFMGIMENKSSSSDANTYRPNQISSPFISTAESFSWTVDATELLLNKIKSKYERLYGNKEKRSAIYDEICCELLPMIPNITAKVIKTKWKNMKARFLKYEENKSVDARRRQRPSMFYEQLSEIIVDRPVLENNTASSYMPVSCVAENGDDTDSENVLKAITPIKKPLKRLKPLSNKYQVVKVIKEDSSENNGKLDEVCNVMRRTNQEVVNFQKRILKDNERRTSLLENILEQMTRQRYSIKSDDTTVHERQSDCCKESANMCLNSDILKSGMDVSNNVVVKTEYDDVFVTIGIDNDNNVSMKDNHTDKSIEREGCSTRDALNSVDQENPTTEDHIAASTCNASSRDSLDIPILHRTDFKSMFSRLWSNCHSIKCYLNINELTRVANATYDCLAQISVEQLSLTREEHARIWRTLIFKRTLDVHSTTQNTSHSCHIDVQDDLLVPRPLSDMLRSIGQWQCKANGVVYDIIPPTLPVGDRPSWTTLDNNLLTRWSQMYASLQDDYATMETPQQHQNKGLPLMLAAFEDHGNMRTVKAQYNDVNATTSFLVFIWNRLFEPQVVNYEDCHVTVNPELSRQKLMVDYVASYRKFHPA